MSDAAEYTIGAEVTCGETVCGELVRVVLDPVARALTHLVVEPTHRQAEGRLVPIGLVEAASEKIRLRCSRAEFDALEDAEEASFLTVGDEQMGYGAGEVFAWPYYGLGAGAGGMGPGGLGLVGAPQITIADRVPKGEVEVRRGEPVHATDGDIGRVRGLVIDPGDHHVTHVLLDDGHMWGKREITIPIGAVTEVTGEGVALRLSREEVRDLPTVELGHHH